MPRCHCLLLLFLVGVFQTSNAQSIPSPTLAQSPARGDSADQLSTVLSKAANLQDSLQALQQLPARYLSKVTAKADLLHQRLTRRTTKALRRLQKQEEKIHARLMKMDSVAANNLFTHSLDSLSHLQDIVKSKATRLTNHIPGGQYIPYLDTLRNSLNFLDKYQAQLTQVKGLQQKLQGSLGSIQQLEGKLDQLQDVQQYIQQRQALLTESLRSYGTVFNKYLGKFGKEAYYYQAQLRNYKDLWQHPDALEAKAMGILSKVPAFGSFMKEHAQLASLFRLPVGDGSAANLDGLQTRAMVEQELQQRMQGAGTSGQQMISQQMQVAKEKLQALKDKLPGGGSPADMPGFKPDALKSRTFLQKLEFGANVQFAKSTTYFPTTSDMAGQVAYRFSKNGSAGLGVAYKLGWGTSIRKIRFTSQGIGLRSFLDYKLKGTFYVNGGFEFHLNKTIPDLETLAEWNGWTRSALLGLEKKYKVFDKLSGNLMLLFDFLYKAHYPVTQPLVFRMGYNF